MKRFNCGLAGLDSRFTFITFLGILLQVVSLAAFAVKPVPGSYKLNERTHIYASEVSADSVFLQFDNDLPVPVTVKLALSPRNLETGGLNQITAVVPGKTSAYTIKKYKKQVSDSTFGLSFDWKVVLGDVRQVPEVYAYALPFAKDRYFRITQGPDGDFSHKDMFAYDFQMPVGTPVLAARDGVIALIKSDSHKGGPSRSFINDANFVSIYHPDGSIANYIHLKPNGILVKEGQSVKKGDLIGYSGNTGFSSGPHLHFEIIQPQVDSGKNKSVAFNWEPKAHKFFASFYHRALNYSRYIWRN